MIIGEQDFIELNKNYNRSGQCFSRIVNLFVIPALLYSVVVLGYLNIINFNVEAHSILLIGIIFLIYINFIKHNAYYASCKFRKQFNVLKSSLKGFLNKNNLIIDDTSKANASIDDFLNEFTRNLRNTNFSSVAFGIFPTLGILGTFISIAMSMPDFSSNSTKALENEISLLLGGVGTAFYVSIYGIFLSIWWIFFEKLGISRFEKDIFIIKEHTKVFFWHKMDIEKIHFQKSFAHYEALDRVFSNMSADGFEQGVNNVIKEKITIFEKMISMEKSVIDNLKQRELNQDSFMETYKNITKDMQELSNNITTIASSLLSMTKGINDYDFNLQQISGALNDNVEILNTSLENISAKNIKIVYESIVNNIEMMKKNSDEITANLKENLDTFDNKITSKLNASLEMIDKETTGIISKLVSLK